MPDTHATTVPAVRHRDCVVLASDGEVTLGQTIVKHQARRVRRLHQDRVLAGFAGSAADGFALFSRFEAKLEEHRGNLERSAVKRAGDWRVDRARRRLEAMLIAAASTLRILAGGLTVAAMCVGCGKKGNPLPPLRPVPARIADLAATRAAGRVTLKFTVPAANLDGTTPVLVDRIDIYAASAVEGQAPPSAAQLAGNQQNLIESLPVRQPSPADPSTVATAVSTLVPQPGEGALYVEEIAAVEAAATVRYYVAVPVVGTGRGRPGPPTPVATVPLGALPGVPSDLAAAHDEANVRLAWTAAEGLSYRVLRAGTPGTPTTPLSTTPVATPEFVLPVEFGREVCLQVQSLRVVGPVTLEGAPSSPVCVTPEDRYATAAPASLQVVQEGASVTIIWNAVDAADLAGYVVWRADGADGVLAPLPGGPVKETTYRDTTVVIGTTYVYAVRAIDTSPAANVSALSPRETITVR